jgi:hypothetical protein
MEGCKGRWNAGGGGGERNQPFIRGVPLYTSDGQFLESCGVGNLSTGIARGPDELLINTGRTRYQAKKKSFPRQGEHVLTQGLASLQLKVNLSQGNETRQPGHEQRLESASN